MASENAIEEAIEKHYGTERGLRPVGSPGAGGAAAGGGETAPESSTSAGIDRPRGPRRHGVGSGRGGGRARLRHRRTPSTSSKLRQSAEDSSTVALMNRLLVWAVQRGASDIHIEPYERYFRVRFRVDGVLEEIAQAPQRPARPPSPAHQDHGEPQHRRAPRPPGRTLQAPDPPRGPQPLARLPRVGPPDPVGREGGPPPPRQDQAHARHDEAGLRAGVPRAFRGGDRQALRHRPGHRPHRARARPTPSTRRSSP